MTSKVIPSLAILLVDGVEQKKDYFDYFVPLLAQCLSLSADTVVSEERLHESLYAHFGLHLPRHVIKTVLDRAAKQKYVVVEGRSYRPNRTKLDSLNFEAIESEVAGKYDDLISMICNYSKEKFDLDWATNVAETALLSFLAEHEFALYIRREKLFETPHPDNVVTAHYVVASFIADAQTTNSRGFEFFLTVVKAHLLTNAIYLSTNTLSRRKWDTAFYFDTEFIIRALGYNGPYFEAPQRELLEALNKIGAPLRCFQHTVDEIDDALAAVGNALIANKNQNLYGRTVTTVNHFRSLGYGSTDVRRFRNSLTANLQNKLKISVVSKPSFHYDGLDEAKLEAHLKNKLGYKRPSGDVNQAALLYDVNSIIAIEQIRRGSKYRDLESCQAIFVTTNNRLVDACRTFLSSQGSMDSRDITHCMTDHVLMNLIWLRSPNAFPDLPLKHVFADCYAALQPPDHLWTSVVTPKTWTGGILDMIVQERGKWHGQKAEVQWAVQG